MTWVVVGSQAVGEDGTDPHAVPLVASRAGPGYRFEVRGHPRLLVRRGAWPDEDAARFWRRRGYEVARGDRLTPEWCREMENRGVAPGRGCEWVALRIVQVREHERGPDGPVVPATRTA